MFKQCPTLPITGHIIKSAINEKSVKLKIQILCRLKINDFVDKFVFIVIPKLNRDCIIGYDLLEHLKINIDTKNCKITSKEKNIEVKYNNQICNEKINFEINLENENIEINKENEQYEITENEIDEKLKECKNLDSSEKEKLKKILLDNKKVFNKKPGFINDFEYELELNDTKPFFVRPYPIPLKRRDKVNKCIEEM